MSKRISVYGYDGYLDQDSKGRSFDEILAATEQQDVCGITFRSLKRTKSGSLPKELPNMLNLKYVDLTSCHLTELPDNLLSMKTLMTLKLAKNNITTLPTNWGHLADVLRELDLCDNPLVSLSETLQQLKILESLHIADCSFSSFPSALLHLKSLKSLDISNNSISVVPKAVSSLQKLEMLNISGCGLGGVPTVLAKLPNLVSLDISDNPLSDLPKLLPQALPNVQTLRSSNCGFRFFPEVLLYMKKLNKLDLSRNPITYVPPYLRESSLYSLAMRNCRLTEITKAISSLHHLDITGNKIKTISEDAVSELFENQANLKFDSDFLQRPPREILDLGLEAILGYFEDLRLNTALATSIQNMTILGETGSGKTSLAQTLSAGEARLTSTQERTALYEEHIFEYSRTLHFQITDLGGHNTYELMYPILVKDKSSIAVIAVDLSTFRTKKSEKQLIQWLQMCTQNLDETSTIMVVGTKADKCANLEQTHKKIHKVLAEWKRNEERYIDKILCQTNVVVDEEKLEALRKVRTQLSRIDATLPVTSAYNNRGISSFVDALLSKAGQGARVLPKAWVDIYHLFVTDCYQLDTPYLPLCDAKAMIKQELKTRNKRLRRVPYSLRHSQTHNKHMNVDLCLRFFHNRGIILWYEKHQLLKDIVILKPAMIFQTMKLLFQCNMTSFLDSKTPLPPFKDLTTQQEAANKLKCCGVATETLLNSIFQRHCGHESAPGITIEILKMMGFCYEVATNFPEAKTCYYFPWFTSNNTRDGHDKEFSLCWQEVLPSGSLELQCQFEFFQRIPLSLFEQLLVHIYSSLFPGHVIETSSNAVHCIQNGVDVLISKERTNSEQDIHSENLFIKMRSRRTYLIDLYRVFTKTVGSVVTLLEYCPCILLDQYVLCPHCLLMKRDRPTRIPVQNVTSDVNEGLRLAMRRVQCHNTAVPAALHFPQLLGNYLLVPIQWRIQDFS